jgi:large subunit ribosomal protein L20
MHGIRLAGVALDRRVLADLAVNDSSAFTELAGLAKQALEAQPAA